MAANKKLRANPSATAAGDAGRTSAKDKRDKDEPIVEVEERTESQILLEQAALRAAGRRARFKRVYPEVPRPPLRLRRWRPPPPPARPPQVVVECPPLSTRKWVPPHRRRRRQRPKRMRYRPEEMTFQLSNHVLNRIWHNFKKVEKNKMMLQGTQCCNSGKFNNKYRGAQTGCMALVCRALLEERPAHELWWQDVDDVISHGETFYRRALVALKCYKGHPALELKQLPRSFFFHDTRYTVNLSEAESGVLAKSPDITSDASDLMMMMEKRAGTNYMVIVSIDNKQHFLCWGQPPTEGGGGNVKTICYVFVPQMLDAMGNADHSLKATVDCCRLQPSGAAGILRYPGVSSFVIDFLANFADLETAKHHLKPTVTLTNIEILQKDPLIRFPTYELDLKALKVHCPHEWNALNMNKLREQKLYKHKYPLASLSMVSLGESRASTRRGVKEFYMKTPKPPLPAPPPVAPERPPPAVTKENIMSYRGEDFFLYAPKADDFLYGRDDHIPFPKKKDSFIVSPVDVATKNFNSQYRQLDVSRWIMRATRHLATMRYYDFKWWTGVACCVAALGMLRRHKARAWNEDTLDETLDVGFNLFRDTLESRGGPIRRLVLGELNEIFKIRDTEYKHKVRGIAVWGKLLSINETIFDLCRGLEYFFKESDSGLLQLAGDVEMALLFESGFYYLYHPWPADRFGKRVSLQGGGKACMLRFTTIQRMCDHLIESLVDLKKKSFSISDVRVWDLATRPPPVNALKPVSPTRWVVKGTFHEGDERYPEEHRNKQNTSNALAAIAMQLVLDCDQWTPQHIDHILDRGDILYAKTIDNLERMGINFETPVTQPGGGGGGGEIGEEEQNEEGLSLMMSAADVAPRFKITDMDCIELDVAEVTYKGELQPKAESNELSLKDSLRKMLREYQCGVLTARGVSLGVWRHENHFYVFDPHGCDEDGNAWDDIRAGAVLVRMNSDVRELADVIMGQLPAGADDGFELAPVEVQTARFLPELGAPETKLENKAFDWIQRGRAAILMGPRGENSALGKAFDRAIIPAEDRAGRCLSLPAAAAFCAASAAVPPKVMHQDHIFNIMDAAADYLINFYKKTGKKELEPEDLTEKFEMGANTFSIELGEPTKLPLWIPESGEGGGDEDEEKAVPEGEEVEIGPIPDKQIKDYLTKLWLDGSKPTTTSLLVGDYHALGVWMQNEGRVVVFDAEPTLFRGLLTQHRIQKGDELRNARLKAEMPGEGGDDEDAGGEGEEQPEPEPTPVPPESCAVIMVFASPAEFLDKLVAKGGLTPKQCLSPYKLYPVTVINQLTDNVGDKGPEGGEEGEAPEEKEDEGAETLSDEAVGKHFTRTGKSTAALRGRLAQQESYFLDHPNRDHQDAANSAMGIIVNTIEPYVHWKPALVDAVLKYGDRVYTLSVPGARHPPKVTPLELVNEFRVTSFNVKLEVDPQGVFGDLKAGGGTSVNSMQKMLEKFFGEKNKPGIVCAKEYCVAVWVAADGKAYCMWDPHPTGPRGRMSPASAGGVVVFATLGQMADVIRDNIVFLGRPGTNKICVYPVSVTWEISSTPPPPRLGAGPDEGYEHKVLTAYVETGRGRSIVRGSRHGDANKFLRDALLQSASSAIVANCMTIARKPFLWTKKTVDEVIAVGCSLFNASINSLGYEFRPGDDILLPLQVLREFTLGANYVRYNLDVDSLGLLETRKPRATQLKAALEAFFHTNTHGILWCAPHATAVCMTPGSPNCYMVEPNACNKGGVRLRPDGAEDVAACIMSFTSPSLMAYQYLQNYAPKDRKHSEFILYSMRITVNPIKPLGCIDPPLVKGSAVPATSKVGPDGLPRRADESKRAHPPGADTCGDAQRATEVRDMQETKLQGVRNAAGWLVLGDDTHFLSANHSMNCKKFSQTSRGNQAVACAMMAVGMSRVEDVCRWSRATLDDIIEAGDQLYKDSYLHFRPQGKLLLVEEVLRKLYTPGNCVCRMTVYEPRQTGVVETDLGQKVREFYREEKMGILVAAPGNFAVALFKTPKGFYMFDPGDRDRYGRAVAPPCLGKAQACFSKYPEVEMLINKLAANIPPHKDASPKFKIYGVEVTSLRRITGREK